jgi:predicted PurR-regulated permease PerM
MSFFANAGVVLVVGLAGWVFLPFLPSFIWALVIYQVVRPLHRKFLLRLSPGLTAAALVVLVTLAMIVPLSFVGGKLVIEATNAYQLFQKEGMTKQLTVQSVTEWVNRLPLPEVARRNLSRYEIDESAITENAAKFGKKALDILTDLLTSAAKSAGGFVFSVIAFLFLFYFACRDGEEWYARIVKIAPPRFGLESLVELLASVASALFWGVAGTCLLQGIAGGIAFALLGLPSPLLAGALMTFCALIPAVGTALVWGPAALWLALTGSGVKALIMVGIGAGVIGMMDNLTRPLLSKMGGAQLSVLTITIGAIGGIAACGLTGIIVGPLALTAFSWLLDHLARDRES